MVLGCSEKSALEKIEVVGSAETEITPDIVYVGISLREYFVPGTKQRVSIESLEQKLQASVQATGIDLKNLLVNNVASYQEYHNKRRNPEFLAGRQYRLKLPDVKKLDAVLNGVDPQGIQYTQIEGYDYSNLDTIRKDLQIKALQAARTKAQYLTESIDKELGEAIEVSEVNEHTNTTRQMNLGNAAGYEAVEQSAASTVDFKTVKLRAQMRGVFRMK